MIIDLILDRKDGIPYNPYTFYTRITEYESGTQYPISTALDSWENPDIIRELSNYIKQNDYSLDIIPYIESVSWI